MQKPTQSWPNIIGSDRAERFVSTDGPVVWVLVSISANFIGIYENRYAAEDMLRHNSAPNDIVLVPMLKAPADQWVNGPRNNLAQLGR